METIWSTEKSLSAYKYARCHYPEDHNLNSYHRENVKAYSSLQEKYIKIKISYIIQCFSTQHILSTEITLFNIGTQPITASLFQS
jgi:hypothetical protein